MSLLDFVADNLGLVVLLAAIMIILATDIYLARWMVRRILLTSILLLIYSITCYIEEYLGNLTYCTVMRPVLIALNYSLVTLVLMNAIMILHPEQSKWVFIPSIINAVICFVSIPTGIVFYLTSDNHFQRGPLGYLTYIVNAFYLVYLFVCLFLKRKNQKEDYFVLCFILVTSVMCLVAPLFTSEQATIWFYLTISTDILMYYVFLLQQYTKCDPLTKLLNRQSYYSDSESFRSSITAVVAIDMDGLKEINDRDGHVAGDTALKTLADCFWKAAQNGQRLYRIGGDEYTILCLGNREQEVKDLIKRIKDEVAKTPYSCSVGYALKNDEQLSVDDLYKLADDMLYEEKKLFYARSGKDRRKQQNG